MRVTIVPGDQEKLDLVIDAMREDDWREIICQYDGLEVFELAERCLAGEAWIALLDGAPVAAWGVQPVAAKTLQIWAFGTDRMSRAVPAMSRHILGPRLLAWIADGYTRVEARSIADHAEAHRWMEALGGVPSPCLAYGGEGIDFVMYAWAPLRPEMADAVLR